MITTEVSRKVTDLQVWSDYQPGAVPRMHAVMRCMLQNTTRDTLVCIRPNGSIVDARSTTEVRRFPCQMLVGESTVEQLVLPPDKMFEVVFRTPLSTVKPVVPFDVDLYDKVQMLVRIQTIDDKLMEVTSGIVTPIRTE